jgi:hypothetical protein
MAALPPPTHDANANSFPVHYLNSDNFYPTEEILDDYLLRIWTNLYEKAQSKAIGEERAFISDFKEIISEAMHSSTQLGPEKGTPRKAITPPHPNGPSPVDESIYSITVHQREPTHREVQEFSLFSKMVFPYQFQ